MSSAGFTPRIAGTMRMTDMRALRRPAFPRGFHPLSATSADPSPMTPSVDGRTPAPATGAPAASGAVEEVSRHAGAAMVCGRVADVAAADPGPVAACRGTKP
jgi:hypothetical protein